MLFNFSITSNRSGSCTYCDAGDTFCGDETYELEICIIKRWWEFHFELPYDRSEDVFRLPHCKSLTYAAPRTCREGQVWKGAEFANILIVTKPSFWFEAFRLRPVLRVSMQEVDGNCNSCVRRDILSKNIGPLSCGSRNLSNTLSSFHKQVKVIVREKLLGTICTRIDKPHTEQLTLTEDIFAWLPSKMRQGIPFSLTIRMSSYRWKSALQYHQWYVVRLLCVWSGYKLPRRKELLSSRDLQKEEYRLRAKDTYCSEWVSDMNLPANIIVFISPCSSLCVRELDVEPARGTVCASNK